MRPAIYCCWSESVHDHDHTGEAQPRLIWLISYTRQPTQGHCRALRPLRISGIGPLCRPFGRPFSRSPSNIIFSGSSSHLMLLLAHSGPFVSSLATSFSIGFSHCLLPPLPPTNNAPVRPNSWQSHQISMKHYTYAQKCLGRRCSWYQMYCLDNHYEGKEFHFSSFLESESVLIATPCPSP